uniref:phage head morphogenesis protein n=1 Tax=Parabacteroides merdae TaxID=46503 RepID=UPI00293C0CEB
MAEEFFRPRPAQRRGGFKLVVDTLYRDAAGEVSSGFTFDRDVLEAFVRRIYEKDFHPMTDIELQMFRAVWDTLDIATDKGFGKRPADDPDHDFYEELKRNNAVFAAFKVHRMQNDMAALLLDSNGVLKPFERWAKEVMPIADHQIYQWLETEYDTAIIRAHQAANWRQFEREKDVLPNLKWMPSTSLHPGADHRRFWGTIRPIDDPFWNNHRPGDRWNCKCSLSSTDEEPTPLPDFDPADKPQDGLENNPGKDARLFSDKHPYMAEAHTGAQEAVDALTRRINEMIAEMPGNLTTFDRDVLEAFVRRIYEKDFHPMTDIELQMFRAVWDTLDIATDKGFGKRPADDPDHDFYEELKRNNAVFAAFKVHRMQNDMAALLLDSNGVLKPFERWAKEVMPIADHQIYQWLETEYDTAIIRAHQAADWRQFEREKDVLPNLKWMPSTSLHPGADHRRFWGTIRPVDDLFWNNHRPGDRWNCKCSLSSTDEEPTPLPDFDPADKPQDGLENNPG